MHHFLYPTQDAYISSKTSEKEYNFGIDEMLSLGVNHIVSRELSTEKTYHYENEFVAGVNFQNFTGKFTGSFFGDVFNTSGSVVGTTTKFTASYFIGQVIGSVDGQVNGFPIQDSNYSGSLDEFSGSINSEIIYGVLTGSLIANCFNLYTGYFTRASGNATGYVTGDEIRHEQNIKDVFISYINRSLIQFDLSYISKSIDNGDIVNPKFFLKLKSIEARELPITYKIYAFPVSQSWDQGDGYFSDGGSYNGVSWYWRDYTNGKAWSSYVNTDITSSIDYLEDYNYATESWARGGGTWYNIPCTQSFNYEVSDINMDVTPIVNSWLSGQIPNEGFILMYGGEVLSTSSNANILFFSNQTNTIFGPKLDVMWDDSEYVTGSFGTGSVFITSYSAGFSGSMLDTSTITGITASGNFKGNAYLNLSPSGEVYENSVISALGNSGNIFGLKIDGFFTGSASEIDSSGSISVTGSMRTGDFQNSILSFSYKNSEINGQLSGSFTGQLFAGHGIKGQIPSQHEFTLRAFQNSPAAGNILGFEVSSSSDFGEIKGIITNGVLQGANVDIFFTGSNCYVTESFSVTSSVEITSSVLKPLNTNKPFVVIIQNLKPVYSFGDFPRIGVFGREKYPIKTFGKAPQAFEIITPKYLPINSYYAIKDNETEEIVIDFDNYTKISCNPEGNYFYLDTSGLAQERYYRILIRVVGQNETYTFDSGDLFKVRR